MDTRVARRCQKPDTSFQSALPSSSALCAVFVMIASLVVAQPASAATILVNGSGQLIGATGVSVNGTFYDVNFADVSCATAYNGCDANTDFLFTTQLEANAASQALLDQVFLDGPSGLFDTVPSLTAGCSIAGGWETECKVATPYNLYYPNGSTWVSFSVAVNGIVSDSRQGLGTVPGASFTNWSDYTLADWALAATNPVETAPEPASVLLLGMGLATAGIRRWRQKRAA